MNAPGVEDGRAFILNAEFLRDSLIALGYTVDRIYDTKLSNVDYSGDPTPRGFADTTSLPNSLRAPYPWDGNAEDIIGAINEGRSLFFHIDHGYTGGWGHPPFSSANANSLTNGQLQTILFNFNCSSGGFDSPLAFSEKLLRRAGGGAVGVFGWTRMSNTKYYRALIEGTLGALWPGTLPSYGDGSTKARLGDPTLEARVANPFALPREIEVTPLARSLTILYGEEAAMITAWQLSRDGEVAPIGRGMVRDGVAHLNFVVPPRPDVPVNLFATKPNAIGVAFVFSAPRE
jgi:peptidase C25-like protein